MAKYSFFQGGPAATDLSGLFAQIDTGAIARGVASASQSIGNAITERYAQTKKDKEGAALTDGIVNSDMGEQLLSWHKLSQEQYKGLNNSQKARLLPAFQTGMALSATAAALEEKDRIKDSGEYLNVANEALLKPFDGNAVENLEELKERERYVMRYDLTREDRKEIVERIERMRSKFMRDLPIGITTTGVDRDGNKVDLPKGIGAFNVEGNWQLQNLPSETDKRSPDAVLVADIAALQKGQRKTRLI